MKLLLDQNLSFKLVSLLSDAYPNSAQVGSLKLDTASDRAIWDYAKIRGFHIVTHDADFAEMSALYGPPPQIVWLRCGNRPTAFIARLLLNAFEQLQTLRETPEVSCLELYG